MRRPPQRTGITRISENTETRETVKTSATEATQPESGRFCLGCDKWHPYLRQAKAVCKACSERLKNLYGINSED